MKAVRSFRDLLLDDDFVFVPVSVLVLVVFAVKTVVAGPMDEEDADEFVDKLDEDDELIELSKPLFFTAID